MGFFEIPNYLIVKVQLPLKPGKRCGSNKHSEMLSQINSLIQVEQARSFFFEGV